MVAVGREIISHARTEKALQDSGACEIHPPFAWSLNLIFFVKVIRTATRLGIGTTTAFLFTLSVQNFIFTNPLGLANPTKRCESLAEGVASE